MDNLALQIFKIRARNL